MSILSNPEQALVACGIPRIPESIQTYHLTLLTLVWSFLNPVFGYLAKTNLHLVVDGVCYDYASIHY